MKTHTTNYRNTFIEIAEDCPVSTAEIPPVKRNKTLANIQLEMVLNNPYKYTSDDVLLECYLQKNNIPENERQEAAKTFFSKGQPCFRSSALGKRYGFGVHHNADGKIALFPVESKNYKDFVDDENVTKVKAMRSKRAK
ncbi:DUF6157 family protein [Kaistella palustris]|uniref:DUF6157 family protein n=1 Tax=Kaistella palustris TaxID=493376 RepID=UPI0003FFB3CD|nr:DUF6157 family protein [Kaistella palustris]